MTELGPVPVKDVRRLPVPELALRVLAALGADLNVHNVLRSAETAWAREVDQQLLLERLSDA